ncbi:FIG00653032: hypothetical protein [hydrothermal vent metagenome]|jgi:Protein of unknown function (DUF1573)|uniref:DUF1573 domain-containing protein n=1 Tax=hydrothermal vent metagenome TaxID=652676 RepID=A0A3B0QQ00_9ZZZZ
MFILNRQLKFKNMKKVILGLSALCLVAFTSCKEDATSKVKSENVTQAAERDAVSGDFPAITFEETVHDFGEIENGTPVETVFSYTNTGNAPLVITDIKSTCGCTVPQDWSKEPLAPGSSANFTVKFNGKGANKVSKTITLTANTESGKEAVKITAFIKPDPNAPQKGASILQQPAPTKSSTQPGHEGHNHN